MAFGLVVGFGATIDILWELGEFLLLKSGSSGLQLTYENTIQDLVFSLIGAALAALVIATVLWRPGRDPIDALRMAVTAAAAQRRVRGRCRPWTNDIERAALEAALAGHGEYELFPCDPALADTAAFCAAYGFAPGDSANTIVVIGKSTPPVYAACVVLATHRLDVNHAVRDKLGSRKASFASPDETRELTGHEIGGVTAFGLPVGMPLWVDAAVMARPGSSSAAAAGAGRSSRRPRSS